MRVLWGKTKQNNTVGTSAMMKASLRSAVTVTVLRSLGRENLSKLSVEELLALRIAAWAWLTAGFWRVCLSPKDDVLSLATVVTAVAYAPYLVSVWS